MGGTHAAHGPEARASNAIKDEQLDSASHDSHSSESSWLSQEILSQIVGVAILEFGVALHRYVSIPTLSRMILTPHSVLIGLTLAVDEDFIILFIVIVFHRGFRFSSTQTTCIYHAMQKCSKVSVLGRDLLK